MPVYLACFVQAKHGNIDIIFVTRDFRNKIRNFEQVEQKQKIIAFDYICVRARRTSVHATGCKTMLLEVFYSFRNNNIKSQQAYRYNIK